MRKFQLFGLAATLILSVVWPCVTVALPLSHFASKSKLASGTWVKIAIDRTGVYEITREELAQMGFSDPKRVQVFGRGGEMLAEELTTSLPDELTQVPTLRRDDKICFYAVGPVNLHLGGATAPGYSRTRNTYCQQSYYFLTQGQGTLSTPSSRNFNAAARQEVTSSLSAYLHEQELMSVAFTGSELLGEELKDMNCRLPFTLLNPADSHWGLTSRIAAKTTAVEQGSTLLPSAIFSCRVTVNNQTVDVPYSESASRITGSSNSYVYYNTNSSPESNMVWFDAPSGSNSGYLQYDFSVLPSDKLAVLKFAKLDYFIITYNQSNTLSGHDGAQCPMGLSSSTENQVVHITGSPNIVVWNVTDASTPVQMVTRTLTNKTDGVMFTPGLQSQPCQYVAFDPTATLFKISGHQLIENQNLHARAVPDMIVLTRPEFIGQAERLAQMHRQMDGMDVLVVDQDQVFNEFSGGTPDAMAVRLMCKMFYDRDPQKFKYLLLFGNISYDNRGITTGKKNLVISYVSSVSSYEDGSYVNDDFYGYLLDGSGKRLTADQLCIGIGHFPVANATEAAQAVDKLLEYVYSTDYGPWRNNYSLWAENSDIKGEGELTRNIVNGNDTTKYSAYQLHESQAVGIGRIINEDCNTQLVPDRAFVRMFPSEQSESYKGEMKRTANQAKEHIREMFNRGQYYTTYVGHGGPTMFSAVRLWTTNDVQNNTYTRLPIMTTATCDAARFDSDHRGIAELMFHKRRGGAIALLASTRQVVAVMNDDINRAFTAEMFSYASKGRMPRLGDAYVAAKNCYGSQANSNKFHFVLLGDPAMRINYPKPLFCVTRVNNIAVTGSENVTAAPLQRLTIEAQVMSEQNPSQVNTAFDGDATVIIYDSKRVNQQYVRGTGRHVGEFPTSYYPREQLVQVTGRVVKGVFRDTVVMPRFNRLAANDTLLVAVYAHQDGTDQMVSGQYERMRKSAYKASTAVNDQVRPVIEAMYLNDEHDFSSNATVGSEATLYVRATDNLSFNTQQQAFGRNLRLTLDGGKTSYNIAKDLCVITDEGRTLTLAMPISGLSTGKHTLELSVSDVCGNTASRSITFVVNNSSSLTLAASDIASSASVQIDLTNYGLSQAPPVSLHITDKAGNRVRNITVNNFPYTWNLTNDSGKRVAAGLYHIYGNYDTDQGYGGSNLIDFVVLPTP